jgi:hypothetical protein
VFEKLSGLVRSSKAVLLTIAVVAVVGVSGTAYAGKEAGSSAKTKSHKTHKTKNTQHGNQGDNGHEPKGNGHHNGHHGAPGAEYGVAAVDVTRGAATSTWATYSTLLGSPVGDTTGGVFRFTCSEANAPCKVAIKAAVLADSPGSAAVYPRVLIYQEDFSAGPEVYCEYGDGSTGSGVLSITKQAPSSAPTYTPVPLNVGLSDDCGITGPGGDVNQITVPAGYYDVHSTFVFLD